MSSCMEKKSLRNLPPAVGSIYITLKALSGLVQDLAKSYDWKKGKAKDAGADMQ